MKRTMEIKKIGYKRKLDCMTSHEKNNFVKFNTQWSGPCPDFKTTKKQEKSLEGYVACAYDASAFNQSLIIFINDFEESFKIVELKN